MRAEVYVHERAHRDVEAAAEACLAYCDENGWGRPPPLVSRANDPLSPDLGSALMARGLGALVVPNVGDLFWAGVDTARLKAGKRRLSHTEEYAAGVLEARNATQRLIELGAVLCLAEPKLCFEGENAENFAGMLEAVVESLAEWDAEERRERSEKGREAIDKARARGKRIGRPPKKGAEGSDSPSDAEPTEDS